jgi:hypothetical protein
MAFSDKLSLFVCVPFLTIASPSHSQNTQPDSFNSCFLGRLNLVDSRNVLAIRAVKKACAEMYSKDITAAAFDSISGATLSGDDASVRINFNNNSDYHVFSMCIRIRNRLTNKSDEACDSNLNSFSPRATLPHRPGRVRQSTLFCRTTRPDTGKIAGGR